jgi:Zn-dependent protease with chaperone function
MDDIASLPLIFLLLNVAILLLLPADFAFLRHQEHEADRFALELTRDNHAACHCVGKISARRTHQCRRKSGCIRRGGTSIHQ